MHALLLLPLLAPPGLAAQAQPTPVPLAVPPLAPGVLRGVIIGASQQDSGLVSKLPRSAARGTASSSIEIDTLDFRPKWTMRFRLAGADSMEIVLRCADTLPPEPRTYDIILLSSGVSHADPQFLSGELTLLDGGVRRRFLLGGGLDRVTFGPSNRELVTGAMAVVGSRLDVSPGQGPLGLWRSRGVEARFTTRRVQSSAQVPRLTPEGEARIMRRALDGLLPSWYGAVNGDGPLAEHTAAAVRAFVERRWGFTIEVDSVRIRGNGVWVQLRGKRFGIRCWQSGEDLRPTCTESTIRRG